jgi:hypothetical protein
MKTPGILRTIVLLAPLAACCHHTLAPVNILPVPPQDSNWEGAKPEHLKLPLTKTGRTELESALRYGLNHDNQHRGSPVEPNAPKAYEKLLDLLGNAVSLTDLSKPDFQTWFPGDRVDQVVDAREEVTPQSHAPVALRGAGSDGKYWWIFYRDDDDHLIGVMVVKLQALTTLVERKK